MTRTQGWKLRVACAALAPALLLTPDVRAQKAPQGDLDTLLAQLKGADSKTWSARSAAMTAAAKKARDDAAALRKQAGERDRAAAAEAAASKRLLGEIQKLEQLRAALAALTFADPAGTGEAKKSPQGQLEIALMGLRKLPKAAWDARGGAMRAKAGSHDKQKAALQQQSKQLVANAATKDAEAKALDAEQKKLQQLQKLVASLEIQVLAKTAPKPAAEKPAVAKKAPAKKPAMTEPAKAKPTAAKPAVAKKAPPKPTMAKPAAAKKKPAAAEKAAAKAKTAAATKAPAKPKPAAAKPAPTEAAKMPAPTKAPADKGDAQLLTYEEHVYPIFDEHCIACHDQGDASGGLDLSTHGSTMQGGSSGKTLRPGSPDDSRLYLLVSHKEKPTMPPKEARIDAALIDTIRTWIAQGAPKDEAQAQQLAEKRAKARAKAAAEAKAREEAKVVVQAAMPEGLPRTKKNYPPRPGAMRCVAASPGAPLLAAPGFGQVLLLHQENLRELGVLDFPFGQVESLSFSADATALVAAGGTPGKEGGAVVYDVRTGKELGRFGARRDAALTASVSPRGDLVAIGGTRRRVQVFRIADGKALWRENHDDWVTSLAFSPDGKLLASADRQGMVVVREATNGREVHEFKGADGLLASLSFSPDSGLLATAGADRSVSLWRMRDGRRLFRSTSHSDQALCLTWRSPTRIVSSGADGRVLVWKTNGSRDPELPRIQDWVYGVAASADGKRLFTADWRGRVIAFDAKTRKVVGKVTPLAVAP